MFSSSIKSPFIHLYDRKLVVCLGGGSGVVSRKIHLSGIRKYMEHFLDVSVDLETMRETTPLPAPKQTTSFLT